VLFILGQLIGVKYVHMIKAVHFRFNAEYINQNSTVSFQNYIFTKHLFVHSPGKNSKMVQKHVKDYTLRVVKNDLFGQSTHQIVKALSVVQIVFCSHERLGA